MSTPANAPAHIVLVIDENQDYSSVIGNSNAPFVNSLLAKGTLFTNFDAIGHPSQPNYLALFSGSTQGVTDDNSYSFPTTTSLAGQLQQAGLSFTGYAESGNTASYHEPWLSFGDAANDGANFTQFPTSSSANFNLLPTVSFVIPNLNDDMTTDLGLPEAETIAAGDQWLSNNLSAYINWATANNSIFLFTFDEDQGTSPNQVVTIAVGAGVAQGAVNNQPFNTYSLLATIEQLEGLPALGNAANAQTMLGTRTSPPPPPPPPPPPATAAPVVTISTAGGIVPTAAQTISGSVDLADAGSTVMLLDNGAQIGAATVQPNGSWSTGVTLANGANTVVAQDVDAAGNVGTSNAVNFTVAIPSMPNLFGTVTNDMASSGGDIYALYEAILGRAPDVLGYESFAAALEGGMSLNAIAQNLLGSAEYTEKYGSYAQSSDSSFVSDLYANALHRTPDPGGLASFDSALQQGASRVGIAVDIAVSAEAQSVLAPVFQSGVFVPDAADAEIARLYYAILDRPPDAAGLAQWENDLAHGDTLAHIATDFLNSTEYATTFGTPNNAQFVTALYECALGRAPDPAGEQTWVAALNQGASRGTIAADIAESPEATTHLASQIEVGFNLA